MGRTRTTRYGNGAGHGGPAKGAAVNRKAAIHNPATAATQNPSGLPGWHSMARAERIKALAERLWIKANTAERDNDQIAAIKELYNREAGMPVAVTMDLRSELERLTDEQLDRAIATIRSTLGGDLGQVGAPAGPAEDAEQVGRVPAIR